MEFNKTVAITGLSGLWHVVSQRQDGLICKSLENGHTQFVPSRKHQFTFLNSITMYMQDSDGKQLFDIFLSLKNSAWANKLPDTSKASSDDLRQFFTEIEPMHDPSMVHISDIKKLIKWFVILQKHDLLKVEETTSNTETKEETTEENSTSKTTKSKAKKEKETKQENEAPKKRSSKKEAPEVSETKETTTDKKKPTKTKK